MKSKGFTLVELLSVIILLSLLMLFVLPKMLGSIEDSIDDTDNLTKELIYDATKQYIDNNKEDFEKKNGNRYCVSLNSLVSEQYLKSPIKFGGSEEDVTGYKSVEIMYNDGFNYTLRNTTDCIEANIICRAVESKTTGNIPARDSEGNLLFNEGDEFTCEVKPGVSYIFFVLSKEGDNINLIMNRNINSSGGVATLDNPSTVAWNSTGSNLTGPVEAMNYLYDATKDWEYVPNMVMNYIDTGGKYGKIETSIIGDEMLTTIKTISGAAVVTYSNLKTRMPSYSEIEKYNDYLWVYDYLSSGGPSDDNVTINTISGYWLLDSDKSKENYSCFAAHNGEAYCQKMDIEIDNSQDNGIRPVITVNKYELY